MAKWHGLEVPVLPRGVYLQTSKNCTTDLQACANTEQFGNTFTNLIDIHRKIRGDNTSPWSVNFWDVNGIKWIEGQETATMQEALDYAIAMLWLGEVQYTLDEGRIDVRYDED